MNYPQYQSHKTVSAAKISAVDHGADGSITVHLEGGFDNVVISHHDKKHKPEPVVGGYLVVYSDGYTSFSPAKAFDEGYTLVSDRINGSPMHLVAAQKAREAAAAAGATGDNPLDGKSQPGPIGDEDGAGDGSGEQLSAGNAQSGQTVIQKDEDDEDEDEELLDAANNHGQANREQPEPVA
jgi:hypothetical protein